MSKQRSKRLTPVETVIMDCLWELGQATVRQVQRALAPVRPMAYNTVLTMMRILRDKGFLASRRNGRMDVYRPRVTREQMGRRGLHEVMQRFFAGSPAALVSELIESGRLSDAEVEAIRREVDGTLGRRKNS